jgi:hypothetical protein
VPCGPPFCAFVGVLLIAFAFVNLKHQTAVGRRTGSSSPASRFAP